MKQLIYTCTRCNKQVVVEPRTTDPSHPSRSWESLPMEWAEIHYRRIHTAIQDGQQQTMQTTCTAHACDDCAKGVLDFIEPPRRQSA